MVLGHATWVPFALQVAVKFAVPFDGNVAELGETVHVIAAVWLPVPFCTSNSAPKPHVFPCDGSTHTMALELVAAIIGQSPLVAYQFTNL